MSDLQVHLALIRENWDRHDHWFDALCNNLVRGHMEELERLEADRLTRAGEMAGRVEERIALAEEVQLAMHKGMPGFIGFDLGARVIEALRSPKQGEEA
ncbi:MAG: hypothetical protein V4527_18305 [Pseudomonadota bacterium]